MIRLFRRLCELLPGKQEPSDLLIALEKGKNEDPYSHHWIRGSGNSRDVFFCYKCGTIGFTKDKCIAHTYRQQTKIVSR